MKKIKFQHYILLVLSVLTLVLTCTAYAFMYHDAVIKAGEEATVQAEASVALKQVQQAKNMDAQYRATVMDRTLLPSFFISADDAVPFIDAVESIGPATDSVLSISSLSSGTDGGSSQSVVTATVSVSGSWTDVMRAVQMIENMPYAISVKDLDLNVLPDLSSKSTSHWTAIMNISVLSST